MEPPFSFISGLNPIELKYCVKEFVSRVWHIHWVVLVLAYVTCLLKKLSTCNDAVFKQGYHGKLSRCKPKSFDHCLVLFKLLLKAIINLYWVPTQLDFWIVSLTSIDITTGVIPLILVIRNFHQLKKLLIGKQFLLVSTLKNFFNNDHFLHYHGAYVWCRVIM